MNKIILSLLLLASVVANASYINRGGSGGGVTPNSCDPGEFADGIEADGTLQCAVPSGGGGVDTVGTFSASAQTNGATISGNTITFGPASATVPGMVSTGAQTFGGEKVFDLGNVDIKFTTDSSVQTESPAITTNNTYPSIVLKHYDSTENHNTVMLYGNLAAFNSKTSQTWLGGIYHNSALRVSPWYGSALDRIAMNYTQNEATPSLIAGEIKVKTGTPLTLTADSLVLKGIDYVWPSTEQVGALWSDGSGNLSWARGPPFSVNRSMFFTGNNSTMASYVSEFSNNLRFERTDPFTVNAWVRQVSGGTYQVIIANNQSDIDNYRGWNLMVDNQNPGRLLFSITNTLTTNDLSVRLDAQLTDDTWHMVTATYDGSSDPSGVVLYLDGVAGAMTTISDTLAATTVSTGNLAIGARTVPENQFVGNISNVAVWDRVLTALEVADLSDGGSPADLSTLSTYSDLIFWVGLGIGNDSTDLVNDLSGNGNDGFPRCRVNVNSMVWITSCGRIEPEHP